ncbi:S46A3-like protein [Mya arenaria]|uniref:S46A3-like protein n=1 Tax=Mya arenaria TaxID=6604 RepID=A0ABY7G5X1_MYAAR|nr:S46A3-like protein [Mya arenaria]WAR29830.1 S46A3-like protein [Mya arenaria]
MELEKEGEPFGSENESTPLLPENRDETATEVPSNVECMKDDIIAMLGTAIGIASYVVEGFAHGSIIWLVPVLSAPTGLPIPMIRSLMSALTPADKQGALFASIGAVETLCALIGSVSNNAIYSATLTIMNGFVFEIMAAFTLIGVIFLVAYIFVARLMKDTDSRDDITITVTADQ